jgi:3-hydroxybutyryl-CoA dehydrogenase
LSDFIGLDTILYIAEYLHKHLGPKYKPANILYDLVNQGKMGRKSGEGFYTYN